MEKSKKGLPKFNTLPGLSLGVLLSALLFSLDLWALIAGWQDTWLPFQIGKILGLGIALGLGIHCVDMIIYHQKTKTRGKMQN